MHKRRQERPKSPDVTWMIMSSQLKLQQTALRFVSPREVFRSIISRFLGIPFSRLFTRRPSCEARRDYRHSSVQPGHPSRSCRRSAPASTVRTFTIPCYVVLSTPCLLSVGRSFLRIYSHLLHATLMGTVALAGLTSGLVFRFLEEGIAYFLRRSYMPAEDSFLESG